MYQKQDNAHCITDRVSAENIEYLQIDLVSYFFKLAPTYCRASQVFPWHCPHDHHSHGLPSSQSGSPVVRRSRQRAVLICQDGSRVCSAHLKERIEPICAPPCGSWADQNLVRVKLLYVINCDQCTCSPNKHLSLFWWISFLFFWRTGLVTEKISPGFRSMQLRLPLD